jgi:hypothetical protein
MKRGPRYPYEQVFLKAVRKVRKIIAYRARRCRKSTNLGDVSFDVISKESGKMVIAASASLLLGKELVGVTLTSAEQAMVVANESAAMRGVFESGAAKNNLNFKVADSEKDKVLAGLTPEDFAELYRSSRMELRLYFDKSAYSRVQVIAPNPATARSWRAAVVRDEAGFTPAAFEQELRNATDPMMRDTPDLDIIYASNLPSNDKHPFFEDTIPREITAETEDAQFPANPKGHLYIGQTGVLVHRVALKDAYAAGHLLYDDEGRPMSYEQCRNSPDFKSGWDPTYALNHIAGGAAAIDLLALITSQQRGIGQCAFVYVECEDAAQRACRLLADLLQNGPVGIGWDVASTTGETSNPSSITVTEMLGGMRYARLVMVFKQRKGVVARQWARDIIATVRSRPSGGPARRLCIDGSNERLFAQETMDALALMIPVQIVLGGASVGPLPPGYQDAVNYKTYLGDLYCATINDNKAALPPDTYIKTDHRLPVKDGGRYLCTPDSDGRHGDTFDSGKLAEYALRTSTNPGHFIPPTGRRAEIIAERHNREVLA